MGTVTQNTHRDSSTVDEILSKGNVSCNAKNREPFSKMERNIMLAEYANDSHWDKKKIERLAEQFETSYRRVWKWHYDRKRV
jgi:hypothetical protein